MAGLSLGEEAPDSKTSRPGSPSNFFGWGRPVVSRKWGEDRALVFFLKGRPTLFFKVAAAGEKGF